MRDKSIRQGYRIDAALDKATMLDKAARDCEVDAETGTECRCDCVLLAGVLRSSVEMCMTWSTGRVQKEANPEVALTHSV